MGYGPPDGVKYGDLTIYSFQYCLERGETYVLSIEDNFGDGESCMNHCRSNVCGLCGLGSCYGSGACSNYDMSILLLPCYAPIPTGLCCDRGYGAYEFALGGTVVYSSDFQKTFNDYVEHSFTVGEVYTAVPTKRPTSTPTKEPTASPVVLLGNGEPSLSP